MLSLAEIIWVVVCLFVSGFLAYTYVRLVKVIHYVLVFTIIPIFFIAIGEISPEIDGWWFVIILLLSYAMFSLNMKRKNKGCKY